MTQEAAAAPPVAPAGFWRRVAAFFLDCALLGALGWLLGLFCFNLFSLLQGWGKLVGLFIAAAYLVPLNSAVGGGQTLGKRWLGIRVVGTDGRPISLSRSLLRYLVLAPPVFLNGIVLPGVDRESAWWVPLTMGIFGLGASAVYLLVFNRSTRQLLHDMAAGSVVMPAAAAGPLGARVWRGHFVVCGLLLLLAGLLPLIPQAGGAVPLTRAAVAQRAVEAQKGVLYAAVAQGKHSVAGDPRTHGIFTVVATVAPGVEQGTAGIHRVTDAVLRSHGLWGIDIMLVTLRSGFDIGIAARWNSQSNTQSPAKWRHDIDLAAALAAPSPPDPAARLVGNWTFTTGDGCKEHIVFRPDGSRSVISGEEHAETRYKLHSGGSGGYIPLVIETLSDDGGRACGGSAEVDVGRIVTVYAVFHPSRDAVVFCYETRPETCWGIYRRVKMP